MSAEINTDLWEIGSGDVGEVVVLDMVSHVEDDHVDRSVVAKNKALYRFAENYIYEGVL